MKKQNLNISDLNYEVENLFWPAIFKAMNVSEADQKDFKYNASKGNIFGSVVTPERLLVSEYPFGPAFNFKYKEDINDRKAFFEKTREVFYNNLKDEIINKLGVKSYISYLSNSMKNKKVFDKYDSNSNAENLFHNVSIDDERVRNDYVKTLVNTAISIDTLRGSYGYAHRTVLAAFSAIYNDAPDLFNVARDSFLESKFMKEEVNKISFAGALDNQRALKDYPQIKEFSHHFDSIKHKELDNFEDIFSNKEKVHYLEINVMNLMKITGKDEEGAKKLTERISDSLQKVIPEYSFSGGVVSKKVVDSRNSSDDKLEASSVYIAFDSRLCSEDAMKKILPGFLRTLDKSGTRFDFDDKEIMSFIANLTQLDSKLSLEKSLKKIEASSESVIEEHFKM